MTSFDLPDDEIFEEQRALAQAADFAFLKSLRSWALLTGGLLLVGFAVELGAWWVGGPIPYGARWNPDQAREAALTLRFLGVMLFAAGLVDRVLQNLQRQNARNATRLSQTVHPD